MTSSGTSSQPSRRPRRRRRSKGGGEAAPAKVAASPAKVLAEARPATLPGASEAPMTPAEIARMKTTLRFLREHRHTLKLKVNAAEDLLLNGRREPTHRGLCQHLLSKLDRTRVVQASERLPPAEATELLAGIVRFAPEIPYVLRFLQCVKVSADRSQAALALTQALERLDFAEVSAAQLRDLLLLIVEVFPPAELPVFAFSLLDREAFRTAFDRASDVWPEALAGLLVPLRALHAALAERRARRPRNDAAVDAENVRRGAELLLGASPASVLELPEPLRERLLAIGCDALERGGGQSSGADPAAALVKLMQSLTLRTPEARGRAASRLASALLRTGREALAREVLRGEASAPDAAAWAGRWLDALAAERRGPFALERRRRAPRGRRRGRGEGRAQGAPPARDAAPDALEATNAAEGGAGEVAQSGAELPALERAFHVPSQREALVRLAGAADRDGLLAHAALRRRALVPGVAPSIAQGTLEDGGAYLGVAWRGPSLAGPLHRRELAVELALPLCADVCRLLASLARFGLALPDAAPARFNLDAHGRAWLSDLWGVEERDVASAERAHAAHAARFCREVLGALELGPLAARALERLEGEPDLEALVPSIEAALGSS